MTLDAYITAMGEALRVRHVAPLPAEPALRNYEKQGVVRTDKAERELGFRPAPLREWLGEVVAWHAPLLESEAEGEGGS